MAAPSYVMDPSAVLDFEIDWSSWLVTGEFIIGTPVIVVPTGIVLSVGASVAGGIVIFWLSHPVVGSYYTVDCTITTNQGRTDSRSIQIFSQLR